MKSPSHLKRMIPAALAAACCALAATLACSAPISPEEHVGVNAERGDPARWYVPADTPQLKYATLVKEANAELGEVLKECRALQTGRRICITEANAQHRRDMADARSFLENQESLARSR